MSVVPNTPMARAVWVGVSIYMYVYVARGAEDGTHACAERLWGLRV